MTSSELTTLNESQWSVMRQQAEVLVKSGFLPKAVNTPEAAIAIMQTGREFGLEPMESFRHIHIINGAPTLAAGFMAALVQQYCEKRGGYLRQVELTDQQCTIEYMRGNWPEPQRFTFSMDDARKAGLADKPVWKQNGRQMLYARALANSCRMGWPDLVSGVYDPDELSDLPPVAVLEHRGARQEVIIESQPQEVYDVSTGEIVEDGGELYDQWAPVIEAAETTDELQEIGDGLKDAGISGKDHPSIARAYTRKMNTLKIAEASAAGKERDQAAEQETLLSA